MAYDTNRFCWHGCTTADTDASIAFYTRVFGWSVQRVPMGAREATLFANGAQPFAHVVPPQAEGVPSHWGSFLRVENVDAATTACVQHGGSVVVPPMDIPPGRISTVASPSGATFSLYRESDADAAHPPAGQGAVHWVELHSTDVPADLAWLKASFGFETEEMEMATGRYFVLKSDGVARGGVMAGMNEKAPSAWLIWIQVDDLEGTLETVAAAGGKVVAPVMEVAQVGRMAIVADAVGAVIGVIKPAP